MRQLFVLLLLLSSLAAFAKGGPGALIDRVERLDKALLAKDTVLLNAILHRNVSYGHSNGWIEHRMDIVADLYNGKLTYKEIKIVDEPQVSVYEKTGIVLLHTRVKVVVDGKELELNLRIWQTWILEQNEWKLVARQSVKVD